ncbi:translocation/assembly module TamB domain-containing protein [Sphingomonas sp.]|uniref:translocation/assembly module TamB domain-containing protein n=1 Tax=Sphingomonas sp. TaxID=28214 RepID=UPI001E0E3073|nr:translocation/assembly module TamB [Sphingomonas sp.]MBX9796906.1 translocation/assembly module TamB domain-containing protein [Sphingomonas sp.]
MRRWRWGRWLAGGLLGLFALAAGAALLLDTSFGHRWIAQQIAALRPADGMRYSVGRISGSIYGRAMLIDVRVRDPKGLVFAAPRAELDWRPLAWMANRLEIRRLAIPRATLAKLPEPRPVARKGPILPDFDILLGDLRIDRLTVAAPVTGTARVARLAGKATIRRGRALVALDALVAGSDRLHLLLDAAPDRDRFDIELNADGAKGGVLARLGGVDRPVKLAIAGDGGWARWRGTASAALGGVPLADLRLANDAGHYALAGTVRPAQLVKGDAAQLFAPAVRIDGHATLANRVLDGRLKLGTAALAVETAGALDLARNRLLDLRTVARLLRPQAVDPEWQGSNVVLRVIADGPFDRAALDYRLTADQLRPGPREGFADVRAAGSGRIGPVTLLPVKITASQVTAVDPLAELITRNLSIEGVFRLGGGRLTAPDLRVQAARLRGTGSFDLPFATGRYQALLNLVLAPIEIDGLGQLDGGARLRVTPTVGRKGLDIAGTAEARLLRLDNEFFAHLAGGLPRLSSNVAQSVDGILHLDNLVITAPDIRLVASGTRQRDGNVRFAGQARQVRYGAATLAIEGQLERPRVDVMLAAPADDMGLADVAVHLEPTAEGYAATARGGSALGSFTARGDLLLPKGERAVIALDALDVADMQAKGRLLSVTDGFDGRLAVTGAAHGTLDFRPVDQVQRVEVHLDVNDLNVMDSATLKRGRLDMVALLDPDGASVEASASGTGLERGSLSLGRFSAKASLRNGVGTASGDFTGARGRSFAIHADADITRDRYVLRAAGQIDRRPIRLESPAVLTRADGGWRLAESRLSFAGGTGSVSGQFSDNRTEVQANLAQMPLTILDMIIPDIGLAGSASGSLAFSQASGAAPTGRIDMTVRGMSRAGLVLSSQPIDVGVAGVLGGDGAAMRVVLASGGRTLGRGQARLAPLGTGTLTARLANAPLFAQVRYDGPADTLWRLTGIELFDLSGPVAFAADLGGKLNDPRIRGIVRAKGARIESARSGTVLTNIVGDGQFSGSRLSFASFAADAGKGGRVSGSGSFDFAAVKGFGIDLKLNADKAVMINRDDIGATITGPITIHSDGNGGLISGDVRLDGSRYRLGAAVQAAAVPRIALREINLPGGDEADETPEDPWRLDIRARAPSGLAVTGLGLNSTWSADMTLGGIVEAPTITGRAEIIRGTFEFSGRQFEINRGNIRFLGNSPPDPSIDIQALADATGLNATIRVTGQATRPEISFASTPALPQDELLSRLLFGTSITSLSAPEALQLAAAVSALQNGGNGLNPINVLRRAVGLDRLRILSPDQQQGRNTSVAAGKFITRRLYAEIITDGAGYSATQIEFRVTRWLSILSTISTLGRQSANVRISRDY